MSGRLRIALSCGARRKCSQTRFYHTARRTFTGLGGERRRQLQALVRRRHNALVDCAPRLPLEYARHFASVLSTCTVLDVVLSPRRTSGFLESTAFSTR